MGRIDVLELSSYVTGLRIAWEWNFTFTRSWDHEFYKKNEKGSSL